MAAPLPPPPDPQFVLRGAQSAVNALHFGQASQVPGNPLLFSGSQNGLIHIWSLQTRRAVTTLNGHGGQSVTWLQTLPQGHQLLSQGRDLQLCLWDLTEGRNTIVDSVQLENVGFCRSSILAGRQPHWILAVPGKGDETRLGISPNQLVFSLSGSDSGDAIQDVSVYPKAGGRCQARHAHVPGAVAGQLQSPPLLLAGYEDGSVALWDISERKVCSRIVCHEEPVMGLDFDTQKAKGVSASAGKELAVWSLDGLQSLQVYSTHELTNPGIAEVAIRPDRKILATAGWDHRIRVFHWRTMKPLAVLAFHSASVHCVAFADDGLLAAGSRDQRISLWSLYRCL